MPSPSCRSSNIDLANAHHTSRNVPHSGVLHTAINKGRTAEEALSPWAKPDIADKLFFYGPREQIDMPEVQSPMTWVRSNLLKSIC